jgi:hypothetical protein
MKINASFPNVFFLCCLILGGVVLADWPGRPNTVSLDVEDVTQPGEDPVRIEVTYDCLFGVVLGTGDDRDLVITSDSGFREGASFKEWREIGQQKVTGVYELSAPDGGWTLAHNGLYAVNLVDREIKGNGEEFFAGRVVGSFSVDVGRDNPVVPALAGGITFETLATPGVPGGDVVELVIATFSVTFPFPVEVTWGGLTQNLAGNFSMRVDANELDGIIPQVETTYTNRVELGMLDQGRYTFDLKSKKEVIASEDLSIGNGVSPVDRHPDKVEAEIKEVPRAGLPSAYYVKLTLTYLEYLDSIKVKEVRVLGDQLIVDVSGKVNPAIDPVGPAIVEKEIFLGVLEPGLHRLYVTSFGSTELILRFDVPRTGGGVISDISPPAVTLDETMVTARGDRGLIFSVVYLDRGGLDMAGIEAQDLTVMNRIGEEVSLNRFSSSTTGDGLGAFARYRMEPPGGSWGVEDRGRYRLLLSEPELVCDLNGNHLTDRMIGYVTVNISPVDPRPFQGTRLTITENKIIGRWSAMARIFVPEDLAVRDDLAVEWGQVSSVGPSFFLRPRFVAAGSGEELGPIPSSDTSGAGMWMEHEYDLGPISEGVWLTCLESNLDHFAKDVVDAGFPDGEKDPFDFWSKWRSPGAGGISDAQFWEYCVGTNPDDPSDDHLGLPKPEIIIDGDGKKRFGLRCRMASAALDTRLRFLASEDMIHWVKLGPDEIEEVGRNVSSDGIEAFLVCLREDAGVGRFRFLKAIAERW